MNPDLQRDLLAALERPHRLGTIGGDLEEQLAHCASFSSVLAQVVGDTPSRGCDLGTGGGLPGVALAALWPSMRWTLVDMRTARADEVERVVLKLGLQDRVEVQGQEAQYLGHLPTYRGSFDVVVARAFGQPSLTAECAAGLLATDGFLIVSEPPDDDGAGIDGRWNPQGLADLGLSPARHVVDNGARFAVFTKAHPTPVNVPRLPPRPGRGWFAA